MIPFSVFAPGVVASMSKKAPVLPQQNAVVLYQDPATVSAADGAPVTSWTDSKSGIVANGGVSPTFVANALNGKPGVKSDGTQYLPIASPGIYKTAIDSKNYTILDVVIGTSSQLYGSTGGATSSGNGFFPLVDGTEVGLLAGNTDSCWPTTSSGFMVAGFSSSTADHGGSAGGGLVRSYLNGSCYRSTAINGGSSPDTASSSSFTIFGANGSGNFAAKTTMLLRVVWNVELTPPEVWQATRAIYAMFGVTHPIESADHFYLLDGNSLMNGVGAPVPKSIPYLNASALTLVPGQFTCVAIGGLTTAQVLAKATTEIDPYASQISGKTMIATLECIANDVPNVTPAQNGANQQSWVTGRKTAFAGSKFVAVSPSDWVNAYKSTSPAAMNDNLVANYASYGFNAIARLDLNTTFGSNGGLWNTYPETGPWSAPFYDGVHFVDYTLHSGIIAPRIQALR